MARPRSNSGRALNHKWNVGASHSLYRQKGDWYHVLTKFPGALFDPNGYVMFKTRKQFVRCPHITIGQRVHVPLSISQMPSYVRVTPARKN